MISGNSLRFIMVTYNLLDNNPPEVQPVASSLLYINKRIVDSIRSPGEYFVPVPLYPV